MSHRGEGPAPGETPCGLDACWCEIRNHSRVVRVDCNSFDGRRAVRRGHLLRSGALYYVDSANNTFDCVRTLDRGADDLYCEFDDDERFVEYYDHRVDPWQLHNLAHGRRSEGGVEATLRRRRQSCGSCGRRSWAIGRQERLRYRGVSFSDALVRGVPYTVAAASGPPMHASAPARQ